MKQRPRIYYSESQKALMWERWRKGESLQHIAQLFNRSHSSVEGILAQTGGIQPAPRRRSRLALTLAEREEISRGLVSGDSIQSIARRLSRSPSTICREIKRNSGEKGYRASHADQLAWERALRPKVCKLVRHRALAHLVAGKLQLQWSPQQIAGWLKRAWPRNEDCHVSHETIYRSLFIQARGALKKELLEHLRRTRAMHRSRHHTQKTDDHGRIRDAVSISERPATVENRAVPGHWEGELLCGSGGSQIATLVERQTRYLMLVKIPSKDSETVVNALIKHAIKLPHELYKSLTWDRGTEMASHKRFTIATDIAVYFCDPKHPWQRGSNENTKRHTHATDALGRGAELTTVRDNLRHASVSTTSIYPHTDEVKRARQIGDAFGTSKREAVQPREREAPLTGRLPRSHSDMPDAALRV